MTDAKGSRAARGWVFFDRDCRVCTSLARRFRRPLEARGFGLAALQDPRVQALLDLPPEDLLREMRVATADGKFTAAPRPSFISRDKSGGLGRSTPQRNCPASRAFSTPAIAGSPIIGRARLECVLFPAMEGRLMLWETQEEKAGERGEHSTEGGLKR